MIDFKKRIHVMNENQSEGGNGFLKGPRHMPGRSNVDVGGIVVVVVSFES